MPNDNPTNLPAIAPKSPLAEGGTINIRPVGDQHQLRIWIAGAPVENSLHPTAGAAIRRVVIVCIDRMGGQGMIARILLDQLSRFE